MEARIDPAGDVHGSPDHGNQDLANVADGRHRGDWIVDLRGANNCVGRDGMKIGLLTLEVRTIVLVGMVGRRIEESRRRQGCSLL